MNDEIVFRSVKSQREITEEWDSIALARNEQLMRNDDISFSKVLKPYILGSIKDAGSIIDVGCGTGTLTTALRAPGRRLLGVDPSARSVNVARKSDPSGNYLVSTLEEWVEVNPSERFEVAVVNMVLMDVPDLRAFCEALSRVVRGGRVIATIAHPIFWPIYWNYSSYPDFDYLSETVVEGPFRTTSVHYGHKTTHFHRPLSRYFAEITAAGMNVEKFDELRGMESSTRFPFPRFAAFELEA